jgi:hypothetical protein
MSVNLHENLGSSMLLKSEKKVSRTEASILKELNFLSSNKYCYSNNRNNPNNNLSSTRNYDKIQADISEASRHSGFMNQSSNPRDAKGASCRYKSNSDMINEQTFMNYRILADGEEFGDRKKFATLK